MKIVKFSSHTHIGFIREGVEIKGPTLRLGFSADIKQDSYCNGPFEGGGYKVHGGTYANYGGIIKNGMTILGVSTPKSM